MIFTIVGEIMKKKSIILVVVVFLMIYIGINCIYNNKKVVIKNNIKLSEMYLYHADKVIPIEQGDELYEKLVDKIIKFINSTDSCVDNIDATLIFTGNGLSRYEAIEDYWLEVHFEEATETKFAGNAHKNIRTLLFTFEDNLLYIYQDDCLNESSSLAGYACEEASLKELKDTIYSILR